MNSQKGFSLIELIIVVVIIGIVAAIAIPNLISSRRAANEASAVSGLRTLFTANAGYAATAGNGSYAGVPSTPGTSSLSDLLNAGLIDGSFGSGIKSGYAFIGDRTEGIPPDRQTFYFATNPTIISGILTTGTRRFGVSTDGVIRHDTTPANLAVPFDAASLATAEPMANP